MSEAQAAGGASPIKCISFILGQQKFCLEILSIKEIRSWTEPTPLPDVPDFVSGAINLRGVVLPVVDFSSLVGVESREPDESCAIIILELEDKTFGIVVDSVDDIVTLDFNEIQSPVNAAAGARSSIIHGLICSNNTMIQVVNPKGAYPQRLAEAA